MAVRIAVFGAGGKMGHAIVRAIADAEGAALVAAVERSDYPYLAADASQMAGLAASGVRAVKTLPHRLQRTRSSSQTVAARGAWPTTRTITAGSCCG